MIQVTPQMRVRVAVDPVDFRRDIDGLRRLCIVNPNEDPFRGTVYRFRNLQATSIKVLVYDGRGFWLCTYRLSAGRFAHWPNRSSLAQLEQLASQNGANRQSEAIQDYGWHYILGTRRLGLSR